MEINDFSTYLITGLTSVISWVALSNSKLREGLTDILLKKMNKTKINKIPLDKHKVFSLLEIKRSSITSFIISDPVKLKFYTTFIDVTFEEIKESLNKLLLLDESKDLKIQNEIEKVINNMMANIDSNIESKINIPKKVELSFYQWRSMLTDSLTESVRGIISDDLIESNYMLLYRTMDLYSFFIRTLLNSGAIEMARLNGAFKGLELNDILKSE